MDGALRGVPPRGRGSAPAPVSASNADKRDGEARREVASAEMVAVRSSVSAKPSMEASDTPVGELKREMVAWMEGRHDELDRKEVTTFSAR